MQIAVGGYEKGHSGSGRIYEDKNETVNITFNKDKKNIKINDNLVLVVRRDYVFEDYNNVFCLNVYYN